MTEQEFNEILERKLFSKGYYKNLPNYSSFPYYFYDENGNKTNLFYIEFERSYMYKGQEKVSFRAVLGDIRYGEYTPRSYISEDGKHKDIIHNCKVETHSCFRYELEEVLERELRYYFESRYVMENFNFNSIKLDLYIDLITKLEEQGLKISPENSKVIREKISETFDLGKTKGQRYMTQRVGLMGYSNESIDLSRFKEED